MGPRSRVSGPRWQEVAPSFPKAANDGRPARAWSRLLQSRAGNTILNDERSNREFVVGRHDVDIHMD